MIAPKSPDLLRMLRYVGTPLLLLFIWDVIIVLAFKLLGWEWVGSRSLPLSLYGSVIGLIVGFRNNSAYARWWEGRTLWGQIVNSSRSLGRQVCTLLQPKPGLNGADEADLKAAQKTIVYRQIAFVHALRQNLRGLDPLPEVRRILSQEEVTAVAERRNVALALQERISAALRDARTRGWADGWEWQTVDRTLDDLIASQGGTERIKNTPLPKQYDFFPMLFVQVYCLLLPVGMVESLGWFTPLGSTLVGFMFLALDKIGRDLENPFNNAIYDVPITSIANTIEANLRQMLGESEVPKPDVPVRGVLW